MAAQKARGAYQASLAELAALLNRPAGSLQLQTGWLDEIGAVPDIAPDEASLAVNPKYALITVAIERARAGIAAATAAAVPDPTLRAGFRRYNDDDSSARSEEHTSELQSLMCTEYAVFGLTKTNSANTER